MSLLTAADGFVKFDLKIQMSNNSLFTLYYFYMFILQLLSSYNHITEEKELEAVKGGFLVFPVHLVL